MFHTVLVKHLVNLVYWTRYHRARWSRNGRQGFYGGQ